MQIDVSTKKDELQRELSKVSEKHETTANALNESGITFL